MKGLKKIIVWTLVPVIVQLIGLFFVDKFYLSDETSFNTKKIDVTAKKEPNKINVKVPSDAKNVSISYNGDYVSYYENGTIKVIDTSNNKKKEINFEAGAKLSSYKWLTDREIMIIAEKYTDNNGSSYLTISII